MPPNRRLMVMYGRSNKEGRQKCKHVRHLQKRNEQFQNALNNVEPTMLIPVLPSTRFREKRSPPIR